MNIYYQILLLKGFEQISIGPFPDGAGAVIKFSKTRDDDGFDIWILLSYFLHRIDSVAALAEKQIHYHYVVTAGRITHSLLAGGDLVRARINGSVTLSQVLERGCALVIAGVRRGTHVDIDPSVEGLSVEADPDRLVQVIVNLVQNACDAVRDRLLGRVRIWATHEADGMIAIRVEDNGPGIAPEVENRLFEPFATTKPSGEGTGLGLYTSYMLVRAMHGTLALENRREGGASAVVRLPKARDSHSGSIQEVAS